MKKLLYLLPVLFLVLSLSACVNRDNQEVPQIQDENEIVVPQNENLSLRESCESNYGNWLSNFQECEYVSEDWCLDNEGIFNECESACRHDEEVEMCTLQCVPVCVF